MRESSEMLEYAGQVLESGDFDAISGTYAFFSSNHGGQNSWSYRTLSLIGEEFSPGMMWRESNLNGAEADAYDEAAEAFGGDFYERMGPQGRAMAGYGAKGDSTLDQVERLWHQGIIDDETREAYLHAWQTGSPRYGRRQCHCPECKAQYPDADFSGAQLGAYRVPGTGDWGAVEWAVWDRSKAARLWRELPRMTPSERLSNLKDLFHQLSAEGESDLVIDAVVGEIRSLESGRKKR